MVKGKESKDSGNLAQALAKQVVNTQKQMTSDREKRENNVIIFNVEEKDSSSSDDDVSFFNSLYKQTLKLGDTPEIKVSRVGVRKENNTRPMRVVFTENSNKRKFLANLYKLKPHEKFQNIQINHDMSKTDREEKKKLLKEAYLMNEKETDSDFKYKVRGPPWSMSIVKVFAKN